MDSEQGTWNMRQAIRIRVSNNFTDHILLIHWLGASADRWLDIQ